MEKYRVYRFNAKTNQNHGPLPTEFDSPEQADAWLLIWLSYLDRDYRYEIGRAP